MPWHRMLVNISDSTSSLVPWHKRTIVKCLYTTPCRSFESQTYVGYVPCALKPGHGHCIQLGGHHSSCAAAAVT